MAALVLALASVGCGGGGGGDTDPPVMELMLGSDPDQDGYVSSSGEVNTLQGLVGDSGAAGHGYRAYYSFGLGLLPSSAQVVAATLRISFAIHRGDWLGGGFGPLVVDHMDYGPTLDASDWSLLGLELEVAVLLTEPLTGYQDADVTAQVAADLATGRARSQFRLRFRDRLSNDDGDADQATPEDADDLFGTGRVPQLVVRYTVP